MSLYPPPTEIETTVFTSVPDEFADPERGSDWIDTNKPGQKVPSFLEGPSFDRNGNLYVTDIPQGRVFRTSPDGDWTLVADYDGWLNGLRFHKDGRIFIADYKFGIMELDPVNGRVTGFLTHLHSEGFKGVSDFVFDSQGRLYFTDQGQSGMHNPTGGVYRYDLEAGKLDCLSILAPAQTAPAIPPL